MAGVLFLCSYNSCRSQIAEGLARAAARQGVEVFSAGTFPSKINPLTIEVMNERGIDIRNQRSKSLEDVDLSRVDLLVVLSEPAEQVLPVLPPNVRLLAWHMPDPVRTPGGEEAVRHSIRLAVDWLKPKVETLISELSRFG